MISAVFFVTLAKISRKMITIEQLKNLQERVQTLGRCL
jgi:hypothetical protein